jgi:hypothetical protein
MVRVTETIYSFFLAQFTLGSAWRQYVIISVLLFVGVTTVVFFHVLL